MSRRPRRTDDDFAAEIDAHLQLEMDRRLAEGATPDEARAGARRAFGRDGQRRVEFYERRRAMWLDHARRDVRAALRGLRRRPGLALLAMATLAIGIGTSVAMSAVLYAVLVQSPPFAEVDRLVLVWQTDRDTGTTREPSSVPDLADLRDRSQTLAQVEAFAGRDVNVALGDADPFRIAALAVDHGFLPMLGIEPLVGRGFTAAEDRRDGPRVALISARLWRDRFASAPDAIGRTIAIDDEPHVIVGVVAADADYGILQVLSAADYGRAFADRGRVGVDAWLPLQADPATDSRDTHPVVGIGRLAPGVPLADAQAEATRIAADLERTYPSSNQGRGAFVEPLNRVVIGPVRPALLAASAAVAVLLVVACVNVACLLLVHAASRAREVAVRAALGAARGRLLAQFAIEGAVLSAGATCGALLLAWWLVRLVRHQAPASLPAAGDLSLDLPALGLAMALGAFTTIGAALVPALRVRLTRTQEALQAAGGRSDRAGAAHWPVLRWLVVAQVALALVLATSAGLLLRSLAALDRVDAGFTAEGVLKAEFQLPERRYPRPFARFPDWPAVRTFHDELVRRTRALPGVIDAAVASDHPLAAGFTNSFVVVGREAEARNWPEISVRSIGPGYPAVTGLAITEGRAFREGDTIEATPVLLINATARRLFFGDRDPLGQQIAFWGTPRTIVGVVADERIQGLAKAAPPVAYAPAAQLPLADTLLVRTRVDPDTLGSGIREVFRAVDPGLAVYGVEPLDDTVAASLGRERFTSAVVGGFALVTLLLAALGVYGVLSHGVAQRIGEIGVRLALGAQPRAVVGLVLRQGLALTGLGVTAGLVGAWASSRLLASLLYGVSPHDGVTFVVTPLVLVAVAVAASWLPARRAARVDPVVALRHE